MSGEHAAIEETNPRMKELRILKIRVPVRHLVNLNFLKVTEERAVSDLVNEALRSYFTQRSLPVAPASDGPIHDIEPAT